MNPLFIANDNVIELQELRNSTGVVGEYINNASVSATLRDAAGAEVTGESWPITMSYVSNSNGTYRTILQNTLPLVSGATYFLEIDADGENLQAQWTLPLVGTKRGFSERLAL